MLCGKTNNTIQILATYKPCWHERTLIHKYIKIDSFCWISAKLTYRAEIEKDKLVNFKAELEQYALNWCTEVEHSSVSPNGGGAS